MILNLLLSLVFGECLEASPVSRVVVKSQDCLVVKVYNQCDTDVVFVTPIAYSVRWKEGGKSAGFGSSPQYEGTSSKPIVTFSPNSSLDLILRFTGCKKCKISDLTVSIK
jgi:hypothetical protein